MEHQRSTPKIETVLGSLELNLNPEGKFLFVYEGRSGIRKGGGDISFLCMICADDTLPPPHSHIHTHIHLRTTEEVLINM